MVAFGFSFLQKVKFFTVLILIRFADKILVGLK